MKQINQFKQNLVSRLRDITNPMNILIPWLNAFFQKYMGNYFNEEIQREKFTTMGLQKLTLKVSTFNQMNLPFALIEGGVGLLQLDLKSLTCKVEDVEIHLGLKTLAQYQQFQQSYQKQQQWADRLQKFKDEIIQKIQLRQEDPNYDAWNIIRQLMQKITIQLKNILVHVHCDELLTVAIQNICLRVRKLQYEKDQAVSTIILGGMSIHLNDQVSNDVNNFRRDSCVFSLQQSYQQEKYDQYMVIHLRTHLQNRLKFSSTISLKYVKFCFNFSQMSLFLKIMLQIIENQKQFIQQHVVDLQSLRKEEQETQHYFTWTDSKYMPSYLIQMGQGQEKDTKDDSLDSIDGDFRFDDEEELLQSEYNIDLSMLESQIIEEREPLKQSLYSASVFKEFVNDEEDRQGLEDLDDEHLILRINVQSISMELAEEIGERWGDIKSDGYQILLQSINYQIMKEGSNTKTTIKNSNLDIEEVQMWYNKYIQLEWSEQFKFDSDIFHSCHEFSVESQLKQNYQSFMEQHGRNCQSKRLLIHIYSGVKINQPIIEEENGVFIENIHSSSKYTKEGMAIRFKMQNVRNQQSVSIANIDIQCEMQNIIDLMQLVPQKMESIKDKEIKSIPNLNLFTIHNIQAYYLHQVNSQELIDKLFSDRLQVSQDYRFLTLSAICKELQIQQEINSHITFSNIDFQLNNYNGNRFESQIIGTICSYRKSLIKIQKPKFNSNILTHRPNICIGLSEVVYVYDKSHLVIAEDILQQFKTKKSKVKEDPFTIKLIIEEVIVRIQDRILVHIHKLCSLITNFSGCEIDKFLTIYNLCVVDQKRYITKDISQVPIYSSISNAQQYNSINEIIQQQVLHFNNDKYSAYQVLFYKQERFNRLAFRNAFFEDAIKYEDSMGFQQTLENLQDSKFINPEDNTLIQNNCNILTLVMKQEKSVHITLQHGIQQLDEHLLELVDFMQSNLPPQKKEHKQQQIKIRVTVKNILLNYFPTYKESTLLKQHLMKTEFVRQVKPQHSKEQTFFSWVRVVVRIKASELQLNPSEYFHVKSLQVYCKSTSRPNISYLNPILLVPPSTLYLESRCFTQGFQLDADEQQLLYLLCFKKLMSIKGVTYLEKKLEVSNISMSLCLDSCVGLMDLIWMTMEKVDKIEQKLSVENNTASNSLSQFTQDFDIFEADDVHHSISLPQSVPALQFTVSTLRVLFQDGRTFPAEMFEPAENIVQNDEANQAGQYFCEHKSLEQYEEVPQTSEHKDGFELVIQQVSGSVYQKQSLSLSISSIEIEDKVKKSKFSKILGQDQVNQNQQQVIIQMDLSSDISLQFEIQPFRVCLSGATVDFFFELAKIEEQPTPKVIYQSELTKSISMSKQQIKDLCQKRGFDVYFQHPNHQKISIKELIIERIKIIITIDGQGAENQKYRHLMKMVKYDNLTVALKKAHIYNMQFERQSELQKLLIDQYINQLKNDNVFIQSLFTQYKMFNNVTNIIQGFKMLLLGMIKKGVRAGIYQGYIPLLKAVSDEIIYITKTPIDVCDSVSEGIGFTPANRILKPIGSILDRFGNSVNTQIPKHFYKS